MRFGIDELVFPDLDYMTRQSARKFREKSPATATRREALGGIGTSPEKCG
jgi:hypothetical protein